MGAPCQPYPRALAVQHPAGESLDPLCSPEPRSGFLELLASDLPSPALHLDTHQPSADVTLDHGCGHLSPPDVLEVVLPSNAAHVASPSALDLDRCPELLLGLYSLAPHLQAAHAAPHIPLDGDDLVLGCLELLLQLPILLFRPRAYPDLAQKCRCLFHLCHALCTHDVHTFPGLAPTDVVLQEIGSVILALRLKVLLTPLLRPIATLPAAEKPLEVDASLQQHPAMHFICMLPLHLPLGHELADVPLNDNHDLRLNAVQLPEPSACEASPHKTLDMRCAVMEVLELFPCDHADDPPLDRHRGGVTAEGTAHEEAADVALDVVRMVVHPLPTHVVGAPMGLDHRGTNPCDRHPLRVFLAILEPRPPNPLDLFSRQPLRLHTFRPRDRAKPPLRQVLLYTVSVCHRVEDA
mmetsp:Transcript_122468/g.305813  ORF Transcript_122468/g.305813 Transcript_122468/m.305813 type:complete len:409 (+) Transcript_122468:408-1634(+)